MALQFDRTIKAGDILTSITVMLSVIALVLSLAKDRATRVSDQANKVRAAAASAIVKLDRWQAVQLSMYQELQPTFVELSEELAKRYDVVATRDKFWRQVNLVRTRVNRLRTLYSKMRFTRKNNRDFHAATNPSMTQDFPLQFVQLRK